MSDASDLPRELPFKISTLVYVRNREGDLLLLQRKRQPNQGMWSPIGGKLEMGRGESPFEAARRETFEEIGLRVSDADLHLFAMISEKNYEFRTHWLMFLFDCRVRIENLPQPMDEGVFAFHHPDTIEALPIPDTDRQALWPAWFQHRHAFAAMRADCRPDRPLEVVTEERVVPARTP